MRPNALRILLVFAFLLALEGQSKKPPAPADYGQWEAIAGGGRGGTGIGLSPDGKWLAYGITRSNGNNELRLTPVDGEPAKPVAFGERPAFSADGKWVAYSIGYSETQQEKLRKDKSRCRTSWG